MHKPIHQYLSLSIYIYIYTFDSPARVVGPAAAEGDLEHGPHSLFVHIDMYIFVVIGL